MNIPPDNQGYPVYSAPPDQPPKKKRHPIRTTALIILGAFGGGVVAIVGITAILAAGSNSQQIHAHTTPIRSSAPAAEPTSASSPAGTDIPSVQLGTPATVTQDEQTAATIAVTSATVSALPADREFGSKPQNGYFVVAHVKAVVDSGFTEGFTLTSSDFYANVGGTHYNEGDGNSLDALTSSDLNQELSFSNLAAGETGTGIIAFDVPSKHGTIVYAPNLDGQPLVKWQY